ncbi:PAS domain-containing protein [Dongia sp.]|uniref:PAS domain-containing protein n=1 Tax=Dongia sp. TaxID=1977262 RepID=UPI00375242B6
MADRPYRDFERADQAQTDKARLLFEYWLRLKRNGRPGPRTAFDPTEVPALLSSLLLGDIEADPFRVFFRLVGTKVAAFSRLDFSGRYLDALDYKGRDSIEWLECYRTLHATQIGIIGVNRVTWPDEAPMEYEFALLPLERDGDPAGSFIAIEVYDQLDPHLIEEMPEVRVFPNG